MVGRRAGAHNGSEPGFPFAGVVGHSLPCCSQGLGPARMQGAGLPGCGSRSGLGEGRAFGPQVESQRIL